MLITGGQGGTINSVSLRLGSMNTRFNLIMKPFERDYNEEFIKFSNDVLIHFQDTRELDTFIYMLQKFRSKNHEYIGDWVEVRNDV